MNVARVIGTINNNLGLSMVNNYALKIISGTSSEQEQDKKTN